MPDDPTPDEAAPAAPTVPSGDPTGASYDDMPAGSGNLPAVIGPPSPAEWAAIKEQALAISQAGVIKPALRHKIPDVTLMILQGRELQIPPVMAISNVHIIDGVPSLSAKLMLGLIKRAGHYIRVIETDETHAVVKFGRKGEDPSDYGTFEYTIEDAKVANLLGKDNWKKNPKAMLRARAISGTATMEFPDVLMGVTYTSEELGATVDPITGEIESVPEDELISEFEATALLERVNDLKPARRDELRKTLRDLSLVIARRREDDSIEPRLPKRHLDTVRDEIEALRLLDDDGADKPAVESGEPVEGQVVGEGEKPTDTTKDDDDVDDAEVVESGDGAESDDVDGGAAPPTDDAEAEAAPQPPAAEAEATPPETPAPADQPSEGAGDEGAPEPEEPKAKKVPQPSTNHARQRFAIACNEASLNANDRHELVFILTEGRTRTTKETSKKELAVGITVAQMIKAGDLVVDEVDGTRTLVARSEDGKNVLQVLAGVHEEERDAWPDPEGEA